MINIFKGLGIAPAKLYIPKSNLKRWATIACDQFTSRPKYWEDVEKFVGDTPSTFNLIMPEAWLNDESRKAHQESIPEMMEQYVDDGILEELGEGMMYVKRTTSTGVRKGLICNLNLDDYEYEIGNKALCRATEGTVESRLPARIEIRKQALLDLPHVMVLLNDEHDMLMTNMELLTRNRKPTYDFDLMMDGGNIKGWFLSGFNDMQAVIGPINALKIIAKMRQKGMLYAVGDGNHSLAAAKKCGDKTALIELVNIYDPALNFEPIHRIAKDDGEIVDYIHGEEECKSLAKEKGLNAVIMPPYEKSSLFKDVIEKGVLPKKTFSMGEAKDKRYYLECTLRQEP